MKASFLCLAGWNSSGAGKPPFQYARLEQLIGGDYFVVTIATTTTVEVFAHCYYYY